MIRLESVWHQYGRRPALRDISLQIGRGEFVCLVGPSASGKTTLMRLIHGEVAPTSGSVWVEGRCIADARSRWVRRRVGVVFQDYLLLQKRNALENVEYALRVANLGMHRSEVRIRARAALAECGIGDREDALPAELSGGQQQRLAVARALASRPPVLLADEPTASLDEANAENIVRLLRGISSRGTTVVLATHDRHLVRSLQGPLLELLDGELLCDGRPDALLAEA